MRTLRRAEPQTRRSQDAETYSNDNGIFFMETSAKTATNVNELFVAIGAPPRAARHARHARYATRPATHHTDLLLKGALLLPCARSPQAAEEHAAATARPAGRHRAGAERRRVSQKGGLLLIPSLSGLCVLFPRRLLASRCDCKAVGVIDRGSPYCLNSARRRPCACVLCVCVLCECVVVCTMM